VDGDDDLRLFQKRADELSNGATLVVGGGGDISWNVIGRCNSIG
jgi:hypothetical protein